jgi:hypothetical protein
MHGLLLPSIVIWQESAKIPSAYEWTIRVWLTPSNQFQAPVDGYHSLSSSVELH